MSNQIIESLAPAAVTLITPYGGKLIVSVGDGGRHYIYDLDGTQLCEACSIGQCITMIAKGDIRDRTDKPEQPKQVQA